MSQPLRVLLVEDNSQDAELVVRELRRAGFDPNWHRVDTETEYLSRLDPDLDIILSDYAMPQFDGLRALEVLKERRLEIPFIIVSGTIGEETAVKVMKRGATDYLLKDRLTRLGPAVNQALEQSRLRREREAAAQALDLAEARYRSIFENAVEGIYQTTPEGRFVIANPALARIYGYDSPEELILDVTDIAHQIYVDPERRAELQRLMQEQRVVSAFEMRARRKNGELIWVSTNARAVRDQSGALRYEGTVEDITQRKEAEQQLNAALHEKEILLQEVHHRVKNNMQVISSLLNLQASSLRDPAVHSLFREAQDRVRSMALVHEQLYRSADLAHMNFADYARDLLNYVSRAYDVSPDQITLRLQIDPVPLSLDAAIPCALILNELASNAFKYAFPGRANGVIDVQMHGGGDKLVELIFRDNGIGLPPDLDVANAPTLGLRLVDMLVTQLEGRVDVKRGEGTEFRISFNGA
ncbi:MAG TPA: histidine kinase dimerization/phosphoacceptor domain -containing protein [Verrucomicrobiae bacterium]|jgi:PAS domain S-box-containing protein